MTQSGQRLAMNVVEKYGAHWYWSEGDGRLVFETYSDDLGLIGAVHQKSTRLFVGCLHEKVKDQFYASLVWSRMKPESIFDNLEEAKAYVDALIKERLQAVQ